MEGLGLSVRDARPAWGGRKIGRRLCDLGHDGVPRASTITEILRRHGRLASTGRGSHTPPQRFERSQPNELWQMDFKGHFAMSRGRCHPLTVLDDHWRHALGIRACGDETEGTVRGALAGGVAFAPRSADAPGTPWFSPPRVLHACRALLARAGPGGGRRGGAGGLDRRTGGGAAGAAAAAWWFLAGIVLFSGSLYVLTLTGTRWWGAVTPLGGLAFLAGWACLAGAFLSA